MGLKIYKSGQGYYTRLYSALTIFVIVAAGCYALYSKLQGAGILIETLVPAGICILFGILIYWMINKPTLANFLISAEGEVKKVSWSSRREIITSTMIVICVVVIMAMMLWLTDMSFQLLFRNVIKIY